jgi:hypothetical protein
MPVRRPEYDTSDTYWASAGPRILSYTWLAHRNTVVSVVRSLCPPSSGLALFWSDAAAYIDNRREFIIRFGLLALSGQPMITQHWGPVLTAPGHRVPSFAIMGHVASVWHHGTRGQHLNDYQSLQ